MQHWKKIKEEQAYKGWRGIRKKYFELPDGQIVDFDIVENNDFISVAAFTENQEAILVRQYRPGPEKIMVSFCEGYIDEGETAEQAVARELLEETGYQAQSIQFVKLMEQAYSTEKKYCFLALDCQKIGEQQLDDTEQIEVFTMSIPDFRRYLIDPKVDNFRNIALGYMALDSMKLL